jgi:DNA repair photolyase
MYSYSKGRGAISNAPSRYAPQVVERDCPDPSPATESRAELAKSIIASNRSPDVPFEQSINAYRGCEHGCIYCFARPTHAYLDLSPGLDFETRLTYKPNAPALLEKALCNPRYRCSPIAMGTNTDPYQPLEKRHGITRALLDVMLTYRHPVSITTKGTLVLRDIDLLAELAREQLACVMISVTTLDRGLKRLLEPRTPDGDARLRVMEQLAAAGIPVGLLFAPVIPALNDHELETIVKRAADAGATSAACILLRLPQEVGPLFEEWLVQHYPLRARHVMSLVRQSRGGKPYDSGFGQRMRGTGHFADLLATRFRIARRKAGLDVRQYDALLDCSKFRVPAAAGDQLSLL